MKKLEWDIFDMTRRIAEGYGMGNTRIGQYVGPFTRGARGYCIFRKRSQALRHSGFDFTIQVVSEGRTGQGISMGSEQKVKGAGMNMRLLVTYTRSVHKFKD